MDEEGYRKALLCMDIQCRNMLKQVHAMRDEVQSLIVDYEKQKGERL